MRSQTGQRRITFRWEGLLFVASAPRGVRRLLNSRGPPARHRACPRTRSIPTAKISAPCSRPGLAWAATCGNVSRITSRAMTIPALDADRGRFLAAIDSRHPASAWDDRSGARRGPRQISRRRDARHPASARTVSFARGGWRAWAISFSSLSLPTSARRAKSRKRSSAARPSVSPPA